MRASLKNLILVATSSLLSAIVFVLLYEGYEHYRYRQWKAEFRNSPQWYGGLTIASPNPVLLWEYRANGRYTEPNPKYTSTIVTNRYGFRDLDYPVPNKTPGAFRVAYIGDSITLGLWVESEHTFVSRLRSMASAPLEVMNFGIDGYSTLQVYELLRTRVLAFEPDRVVYVMCLNDFDFDDASGAKIRFFKPPTSFLLQRIESFWRKRSGQEYHEYYFRKNKEAVFERIGAMKRLLEPRRIDFQVAIVPVFEKSTPQFSSYRLGFMHEEIVRRVTAAAIPVIDLLESFKKLELSPRSYAYDVWHPNENGHRVIAEGLSRTVLLPDDPRSTR